MTTPMCETTWRACWDRAGRFELVSDGAAALEAARQQPPDLVLTDVMMPSMTGFDLLRACVPTRARVRSR